MSLNERAKQLAIQPTDSYDGNIYDLRRQIDANDTVKEFIRLEIERLQMLLEQLNDKNTGLWLQLKDRKPIGEPQKKRFLHSPQTVLLPMPGQDAPKEFTGE